MVQENEIELAERKYRQLLELLQTAAPSAEEDQQNGDDQQSVIDTKYEEHLLRDLKAKLEFLKIATRQNKLNKLEPPKSTKASIVGTIITNEKLPFHHERDDNIDIALANSILQRQVDDGVLSIDYMRKLNEQLQLELDQQVKIEQDLTFLKESLRLKLMNPDIDVDTNEDDDNDDLKRRINDEKTKHKELKRTLEVLKEKYDIFEYE